MSDFYTELEDALLATLQQEVGLAGVRTWESDLREVLFAGDKLSKGFDTAELPAVNVTAMQGEVRAAQRTVTETDYTIPVTVVIVTSALTKREARARARKLQEVVERRLNLARTSAGQLLPDTWVMGDLVMGVAVVADSPHHFAIAEVEAELRRVM